MNSNPPITSGPVPRWAVWGALVLGCELGCAGMPWQCQKEHTSIITPAMRISAIREGGSRATGAGLEDHAQLADELALQIRTERDPLVRKAIQETAGELEAPLAREMLIAGLSDDDLNVRLVCCQMLGKRGEPENVAPLQKILEKTGDLDLRLAAADALGQIRSPESIRALGVALKDRDPALQFAAVEAMKNLTDQDLGYDVKAWQQFAEQGQLNVQPEVSLAQKVKQISPF